MDDIATAFDNRLKVFESIRAKESLGKVDELMKVKRLEEESVVFVDHC